jgi:hypothetical protein
VCKPLLVVKRQWSTPVKSHSCAFLAFFFPFYGCLVVMWCDWLCGCISCVGGVVCVTHTPIPCCAVMSKDEQPKIEEMDDDGPPPLEDAGPVSQQQHCVHCLFVHGVVVGACN